MRQDPRDAILERLMEDRREIKTTLGITRRPGSEMPPPQSTRVGRNPNALKHTTTYARAVRTRETERQEQPLPTEGLQRTRIITRSSRGIGKNNYNHIYMTDTQNETQSETTDPEAWTNVSRKRRKERIKNKNQTRERSLPRRKASTTAAITLRKEREISNAQLLRIAKEKIFLKAMEIENTKIRHLVSGNLIIEVTGSDNKKKADLS